MVTGEAGEVRLARTDLAVSQSQIGPVLAQGSDLM